METQQQEKKKLYVAFTIYQRHFKHGHRAITAKIK